MIIIAYYKHHYERTLAAIIRDEPHEATKRAIHLLAADTPFCVAPIQAAIVSEALSTMLPKRARRAPKQCYSQSRSLFLSLRLSCCPTALAVPLPDFLFTFLPQYDLISWPFTLFEYFSVRVQVLFTWFCCCCLCSSKVFFGRGSVVSLLLPLHCRLALVCCVCYNYRSCGLLRFSLTDFWFLQLRCVCHMAQKEKKNHNT